MRKTLGLLTVLGLGVILGYITAYFAGWTGVIEIAHTEADYKYLPAPDGSFFKVPTHEEQFSISAHSEPYRPSPVVDLFDKKEAKP